MGKLFLFQILISLCYIFDAAFIHLFEIPFYLLTLLYLLSMAEMSGLRMIWRRLIR